MLSLFIMVKPCLGDANLKAEKANHTKLKKKKNLLVVEKRPFPEFQRQHLPSVHEECTFNFCLLLKGHMNKSDPAGKTTLYAVL